MNDFGRLSLFGSVGRQGKTYLNAIALEIGEAGISFLNLVEKE